MFDLPARLHGSLGKSRFENDLGVVVLLAVPVAVHVGGIFERGVMRHERGHVELAVLDHRQELAAIFLDRGLAAFDRQPLFHKLPQREFVGEAAINAGNRDSSTFAAGQDRLAQSMRAFGYRVELRLDLVEDVVGREAVALHADAVDARIGSKSAGHLVERLADRHLRIIEDFGAQLPRERQPRREMINCDHPTGPQQQRRLDREQTHRAAAPDRNRVTGFDVGIDRRVPPGGQNIGQKQHVVVGQIVGDDHRTDIGIGYANIFGLPTGIAPCKMGVAKGGAHRVTHQQLGGIARFRWIAVIAGAVLLLLAEEALPAADRERNHDALAFFQGGSGADFDDFAHKFMADNVARAHAGNIAVVEMKIGAADGGRGNAEDRIARIDDFGIGNRLDADLVAPLPGDCSHDSVLRYGVRRGIPTRAPTVRRCW